MQLYKQATFQLQLYHKNIASYNISYDWPYWLNFASYSPVQYTQLSVKVCLCLYCIITMILICTSYVHSITFLCQFLYRYNYQLVLYSGLEVSSNTSRFLIMHMYIHRYQLRMYSTWTIYVTGFWKAGQNVILGLFHLLPQLIVICVYS